MKVIKIKLGRRYSDLINRCILDKQHLLNNLIILWNKNNDEIRNDLLNPFKFRKKIMGKLPNDEYVGEYASHWNTIMEFKSKYTYDGLNSILREFAKDLKVNLKAGKKFTFKPRKMSSVNTGSYLIENNNLTYHNGSGGKKRMFSREIAVSLFNPKYLKDKGMKNNLKVYFNDEFMGKYKEIRTLSFVKKWNEYYAYITYLEEDDNATSNPTKDTYVAAIDPGSNNHVTLISNNPDSESLLISYSSIKRLYRTECNIIDVLKENYRLNKVNINRFYSKRHRVFDNEINKMVNRIRDYCVKYNIKTLVIGRGFSSKNNSSIGKNNNRKFHSFPHYTLKIKLIDRLLRFSINVVEQEESYTSKISCINPNVNVWEYSHDDKIRPTTEELKQISRSHQSVLRDKYNMVEFNADVNGAFNILMKYLKCRVIPKHSQIFHPIKIKNDFKFLMVLDS